MSGREKGSKSGKRERERERESKTERVRVREKWEEKREGVNQERDREREEINLMNLNSSHFVQYNTFQLAWKKEPITNLIIILHSSFF